jgi:hypothetical protein
VEIIKCLYVALIMFQSHVRIKQRFTRDRYTTFNYEARLFVLIQWFTTLRSAQPDTVNQRMFSPLRMRRSTSVEQSSFHSLPDSDPQNCWDDAIKTV